MAKEEQKCNVRAQGPSISKPIDTDVSLSASQLAKMVNVHTHDVQYWARFGYLARRGGEENAEDDPHEERKGFNLSQLPKAQLMALFSKRLQTKPSRAAELADEFLESYGDGHEPLQATIALVEWLDTKFTALIDLLLKIGFMEEVEKALEEENS